MTASASVGGKREIGGRAPDSDSEGERREGGRRREEVHKREARAHA